MIETSLALFSLRKWLYEENYVKNQKVKRSLLCERGLGGGISGEAHSITERAF